MRQLFLTIALCIFATASFSPAFAGKPAKKMKLNSKTVESTRGANPNIKMDRSATDNPEKQARGNGPNACDVYFYNHTGYTIDVYVDGYYKGTIAAYGSGVVTVGNGWTNMYCESIGKTKYWSGSGDCNYSYTWDLYN
jgi:hypothetical protein